MNQATTTTARFIPTDELVYVLAKKGGWSTVVDVAGVGRPGREFKVRNSALHVIVETPVEPPVSAEDVPAPQTVVRSHDADGTGPVAKMKAEKAAAAARQKHHAAVAKMKAEKAAAPARQKLPLDQRKNGVVDSLYLQFYKNYSKTVNGQVVRSLDKGDFVAVELRKCETLEQVYDFVASQMGLSRVDLVSRYAHLNTGMQRMNLGNMLRRYLKGA